METFSALLALCAGNYLVTGEFPAQRWVTRSFDVFFDLHLNERLSEQSWGWWFETALPHYDVIVLLFHQSWPLWEALPLQLKVTGWKILNHFKVFDLKVNNHEYNAMNVVQYFGIWMTIRPSYEISMSGNFIKKSMNSHLFTYIERDRNGERDTVRDIDSQKDRAKMERSYGYTCMDNSFTNWV